MGAYSQFKNLVFEGAGIRGIAYGGVVRVLEDSNKLKNIKQVGGTSAGALTAMAVALGYPSYQIDSLISNTNFKKLNDGRFFFIGGIPRLMHRYGWYRGEKFKKWISKVIEAKTQDGNITFEELHQQGFIDLFITGTCLNQQKLIVFSRHTYPKMKVKDALRISMSIPLYFTPVWIDEQGTVFKKNNTNQDLNLMMDGGLLANLPIQIFDDSSSDGTRIANPETLAIRIDSDDQIASDKQKRKLVPMPVNSFGNYITAFYVLLLETTNRSYLTDDDWSRTVSVSSKGIGPKIKKLSAQQKQLLQKSGVDAMTNYLKKINKN